METNKVTNILVGLQKPKNYVYAKSAVHTNTQYATFLISFDMRSLT